MKDTRFQLVLDDIDAAILDRNLNGIKASNAAVDDARTKLVDIADEGPGPTLMAFINVAIDHLNKAIEFPACSSYLVLARAAVDCASEVA